MWQPPPIRVSTMTIKNTDFAPFALTDITATLQGLKPLKPRNNKDVDALPLKVELCFIVITDDFDLLKCFHNDQAAVLSMLYNPTIKGLAFDCRKEHYDLTINDGLELENATLHGFKAALINVKASSNDATVLVKHLHLTFKAVFAVDGRNMVILSDFWKEKITLSLEPSPTF